MEKVSLRKILVLGLTIGIILLVIPILVYGFHFHWNNLSNNTSDWGAFSDFVGGILNPIFLIFNTLILIYLTIKVSVWETNRVKESLTQEYRMRNYELKYSSLKDFGAIFTKFSQGINSAINNKDPLELIALRFEFEALVSINKDQFEYFRNSDNAKKIITNLQDLMNSLARAFKEYPNSHNIKGDELSDNFKKLFEDYGNLLSELRLELNKSTNGN